ncbi:MAG TPA: DNA-3-methyladenine glycosylase [candidate division Zixibacteria bacterium]|nr:DNA-3-methyladenine glycosylase [candidate division Zixibacteria bacterium]
MTPAAAEASADGPGALDRSWFDRPSVEVAPDLLGCVLVHDSAEGRVAGRIVEVEAYQGPEDRAAHSSRGRTARNAVMFGPPGHLYVYLIYGLHHCANVVCGPGTKPEAVLLRAAAITEGLELARRRRGPVPDVRLAAGPGNLGTAFGLDRSLNGVDLLAGPVRILPGLRPASVTVTPRIGVDYAGEWAARPLRFLVTDDPHRSRL